LPLDDNYLTGTTLYGSVFGEPILSLDIDGKGEYYLLELLAEKGSDPEATKQVPTFGFESPAGDEDTYPLSTHFYLDWNSGDDHKAQTIFLTAEQDPHDIYPWLLAHHSIYNEQFETGHRLIDGSEKSGAEFECLTSQDCLSGYCNNFDYSRGACVDADGNDILCDCWLEAGKTLCMGAAAAETESWDNPSVDVEIPIPLPAALDSSADGQQLASLPSIGTVRDITFTSNGKEPDEDNIIEDYLSPMPILILDVGGLGTRYQSNDGEYYLSPDYQVRTWTDYGDSDPWHNTAVRRMNRLLNPCSAVPEGWINYWSVSWSGASYWSCCDGTSSCCNSDNGYDPEDDTHYCNAYNDALWSGGSLVSRFVENYMAGHKNEISVCYSKDAYERMGNMWGWSLGSDTALRSAVEEASEMSFCEYMGKLENKYDRKGEEHVGCYLYESGGHYPMGDNDKCLVESEAYLVIEPTFDEDSGRWFFGNCMMDATGKDLEINQYGTCESCGYLTMAKQEITSLPSHDWEEPELDEIYDAELQANRRTGNMYCPNLVVKTPLSFYDLYTLGSESAVYALTPFMMSGYVQVQYGSAQWGSEIDFDRCVYPNGREVVRNHDDYDMARYRGLPNVLPDAYYLSSKLESLMKRNVQPVLFATDNGLWDDDVDIRSPEGAHKKMDDAYRVAIQLKNDDGEYQWATTNFLRDLYEQRQDLFILAKE